MSIRRTKIPIYEETTIDGPLTRRWRVEAKDCPEFAAHHIARLGIEIAHYPYSRVRLRPAGSFFLACLEGEGRVRLEGRWQRVFAGSLCMAPPRVLNALFAPTEERWVYAWVLYDEPPWMRPLVGSSSPMRVENAAQQLGLAINGFRAEWESERDPAQLHHWVSLVHSLTRRHARRWHTGSRAANLWEIVVRELHTDWKLSSLAARCNMSAEHLRRLCLKELGRTPMAHVTYMRIQRAQELLEISDDKLEVIAAQVGYHSARAFARAFSQCIGMSPSEYRDRVALSDRARSAFCAADEREH